MSQSYVRIDHNFLGVAGGIASYLIPGSDLTLIEAGPASTTPTLLSGIRSAGFDPSEVTRVLLTHIHLDHAGASGVLARHMPRAQFFVHPKGAKHLIDPSRLVASAERIYGDRMAELWGEILPVPTERVCVIEDGAMVGALRALDTPGHAVHHYAYYDAESGVVFTGDIAGVRVGDARYVRPPTPPPELDVEAWAASVARVRALAPRRLCLTHFGEYEDIDWHFDDLIARLTAWREWLGGELGAGHEMAGVKRALAERERGLGLLTARQAEDYERLGSYDACVDGFARYFAKRYQA